MQQGMERAADPASQGQQTPYYPPPQQGQAPPPQVVQGRPPLVSIISPDDARKIRKMQWINFTCTMLQLICSLAIILIVRNNLTRWTPQGQFIGMQCYAATDAHPSSCEYAYSLASVSIFFCFILSLMQCLTMDCCGMGRAVEAGFDAAAAAWWIAGGITLGIRASDANSQRIARQDARNAVVALCWISAALFLALLVTNLILIKKLGRAYKEAAQQMQQHMTAYPLASVVQMGPVGQHGQPMQYGTPYGPPGNYGYSPQPYASQQGPYPPHPGYQQQPPSVVPGQQQQQWGPAPGYPTTPPYTEAAPPAASNPTRQHAV